MKNLQKAQREYWTYMRMMWAGEIKAIKTPWPTVNEGYFNGLGWRWIITLAGRSGSGKTAAAIYMMMEIDRLNPDQHIEQLFYSFEMPGLDLAGRIMSYKYGFNQTQFQPETTSTIGENKFKEIYNIERTATYSDRINIIEETMTAKQLDASIRGHLKRLGVKSYDLTAPGLIVYIDHTKLIKDDKFGNGVQTLFALYAVQNEIKKQYPKVLFFNLSQLNREIEGDHRRSKSKSKLHAHYPVESDLYGASAAQQYSDCIWVLHNPLKLGIYKYGPFEYDTQMDIFFHNLKSRHAEGFEVILMDKHGLQYSTLKESA